MQIRPAGLLLVAVAAAAPLPWFFQLAGEARDPVALFSQFLGAEALILMGIAQFLATRLKALEIVFGGMDRIYVLHKWLGVTALVLVLGHDTIDAEAAENVEGFWTELGETLGEFGLYGLLALITLTVITVVPYEFWRWTHRFVGLVFAMSALHFLLVEKPFELFSPVSLYIQAFCLLGVASYVFALLRNTRLTGAPAYRVTGVADAGDAVAIDLAPVGRPVKASPGQFAFVRFDLPGLGEVHPFTLSRAPDADGGLTLTAKPLGDFTQDLKDQVAVGTTVRLAGGYGRFQRRDDGRPEIWIAGGVGVTPFVAWATDMTPPRQPIDIFYSVRDRAAAPHLDLLQTTADEFPNVRLHVVESDVRGRLTAAGVVEAADSPISDCDVYFCGPPGMRDALRLGLIDAGLPARRFYYEHFEIRSGIGLGRLLAWALARFR